MSLKVGDTVTVTRDGKVFLTQYTTLGAFVSISRKIERDPESEYAELQKLADKLWAEAMLKNHKAVNGAYEALGDGDIEALISYLENKARGESQAQEARPVEPHSAKLVRKLRRPAQG